MAGAEGLMADTADVFGNDKRVELLWAHKAFEHAEVYFNILCTVDPKSIPRLSPCDDKILVEFRREFPKMKVDIMDEMRDFKSEEMKKRWREFCQRFSDVEDYTLGTLLRLDSSGEYDGANSIIVAKVQFYAIELARNKEGCNDSIRKNFKPNPRTTKSSNNSSASGVPLSDLNLKAEVEAELGQILSGQHQILKSS